MTTLGTHNTLDGKAPATDFADVIFFTEAISEKVRRQMSATHDVYVCRQQHDLVIAVRKGILLDARARYKKALPFAVRKVTPNRGTFWLEGRGLGERLALLDEHRINAAFPPYVRGEGLFRRLGWETHTAMTLRIVRRLKKRGYTVHAGGDLNTPKGVKGYRGVLNEVGTHFDRLGSTERLGNVEVLSRLGSDHNRLKATVS